MRSLLLSLLAFACSQSSGQHYHWNFAMSTGICPNGPLNYPFDYSVTGDNLLKPIAIETDYQGNMYVFGTFRPINNVWPNEYKITGNVNVNAVFGSQTHSLYFYKIDQNGDLVWANAISHETEPIGSVISNIKIAVNPFSGKVYIQHNALNYFYVNQQQHYTNFDNSRGAIKRMMLCFNADGSYQKVIGSVAVMEKPLFISASEGVYKGTKLSEFYPWEDSASFYKFDADKDSITQIKFANYQNLIHYDKVRKVFITPELAEFNLALDRIKSPNQSLQHLGRKLLAHKKGKKGSNYFLYVDANLGNVLVKYNPNQSKAWQVTGVETFDLDSNDNPWIFTQRKADEIELSDVYLVMLDSATGAATGNRIVPTNMVLQTNETGLLKITENNEYIIAGFLYNEAEFGNIRLSMSCPGDYLALQHYVARAREGWKQDRKNLGVDDPSNTSGIALYPNPTRGIISISNPEKHRILGIEVMDMAGRKQAVDWQEQEQSLNLQHLNNGLYFVRIFTPGHTQTVSIIKQ